MCIWHLYHVFFSSIQAEQNCDIVIELDTFSFERGTFSCSSIIIELLRTAKHNEILSKTKYYKLNIIC